MHRQARIIRICFLNTDFSHCRVKILVNPLGLTAFCALHCKKSAAQKIFDPKRAYFCVDFYAEDAIRLSPYKDDKWKYAKNTPFWAGSDYSRLPRQAQIIFYIKSGTDNKISVP